MQHPGEHGSQRLPDQKWQVRIAASPAMASCLFRLLHHTTPSDIGIGPQRARVAVAPR